jgi:hypothetical protein
VVLEAVNRVVNDNAIPKISVAFRSRKVLKVLDVMSLVIGGAIIFAENM